MTTISDDAFVRLFQERGGLDPVDGWAGKDTLALLDRILPPRPSTDLNAAAGEIPEDYWPMLSKIESDDKLYALPPINPKTGRPYSSASGLYQFIQSTWEGEGGRWGSDPFKAFGGLQPSAAEQLQRARSFTAKNAAYLRKRGIPINRASLYAAHFLGPVTAAAVIGADVKASAERLAGAAATRANPTILKGKTVGQFLQWLHSKTGEWAR
jgi:hypothetical protein